jgi:O-antigen/teichoic acid export membrane protein
MLKFTGEPYFIRMLAGIVSIEAISSIPFAKLRIENRARKFAILRIVQVVLNIGIMLFIYNILPLMLGSSEILYNQNGVISAKYIFLSNLLSSAIILVFLFYEFKDFRFHLIDFKLYSKMLVYSLPLLLSGLAGVVNETLDRSIFKHVITDTESALFQLGIYGANYKLASIVMIFVQMFRYAAEPFFFNYEKEKDSKERYAQVMHIFVGLIVLLGLTIVIYLDLFKYFLGSEYHIGSSIVPYIVFAYILYGILFNLSVWFKLSHKTYYAIIITIVGAIITFYINIKFIPEYSYYASAVAHVFSYFVMVIISYMLGKKYFKIPYNLKRIFTYLILGLFIYLVNELIKIENYILNFLFKTILVSLFAIFVIWKEKLYNFLKRVK